MPALPLITPLNVTYLYEISLEITLGNAPSERISSHCAKNYADTSFHPLWCIHLFLWGFLTSFCVYVWLKVTIIQKVFSFLLPYLFHFSLTKYRNFFSPFKLLSKKLSVPWLSPDNSKAVEGLFTILLNGMLVHDFFPQIG